MTIKSELLQLQKRDGVLKPERAVEWARSHPKSALHASLEWDDNAAANEYRLWQIRRLIAVHVVSDEGVRQLVSLTIDRTVDGGGYRNLQDVLKSPSMRDRLLEDALADLERIRLKYHGLVELARVWEEAHRVRSKQAKRNGPKLRHERSRPAMQA
jgi:hypothetical protein